MTTPKVIVPVVTFDHAAADYDTTFEDNPITRAIRPVIWNSMRKYFNPGDHVLDLGCGTGTDAIMLASIGIHVTAIDSSSGMLERLRGKIQSSPLEQRIRPVRGEIENLALIPDRLFDGAYSNFGALNCTTDLSSILNSLSQRLKPGASIILCLLNRICLWEILGFLRLGKFRSAFRRWSKHGIDANVDGATVHVCYYSPRQVVTALAPLFHIERIYGLSIFSPPPGSRRFFTRFPNLSTFLFSTDKRIRTLFPFRSLGDHFVIEARRRS